VGKLKSPDLVGDSCVCMPVAFFLSLRSFGGRPYLSARQKRGGGGLLKLSVNKSAVINDGCCAS